MTYREPDLASKVEELSATMKQLKVDVEELRTAAKQSDRAKKWATRWERLEHLFDMVRWPAFFIILAIAASGWGMWRWYASLEEAGRRCAVICESNDLHSAWYVDSNDEGARCYCRATHGGIVDFYLRNGDRVVDP